MVDKLKPETGRLLGPQPVLFGEWITKQIFLENF